MEKKITQLFCDSAPIENKIPLRKTTPNRAISPTRRWTMDLRGNNDLDGDIFKRNSYTTSIQDFEALTE